VERREENENWWDREEPLPPRSGGAAILPGRQAELFDDAGQAIYTPAPTAVRPGKAPAARPAPRTLPQTVVSVRSRSATSARVLTTTRVATATRVAAVSKGARAARGTVARQLMMSQSISSGREAARWFSVPQRVLLPRYQLFEGASGVSEDAGGLRIRPESRRASHGHVWFV